MGSSSMMIGQGPRRPTSAILTAHLRPRREHRPGWGIGGAIRVWDTELKLRATGGGGDSLGKGRSGFQRWTLWSTFVFLYEQVEFAPKWFFSPLANILNLVVPLFEFLKT